MTRLKAVLLILLVINVTFTQGYLTRDAYLYSSEFQEIQELLFPMSKGVDMTEELNQASEIARKAKTMVDNVSQVTKIAVDFADNTNKVLKAAQVLIKVTKFLNAVAQIGSFIPGLSALSGVLSLVDIFDPKPSDTDRILEQIEVVNQKIDKLEITVKVQADRIIKKVEEFGCKIYFLQYINLIKTVQRTEREIIKSKIAKTQSKTKQLQQLLVTQCGGNGALLCFNAGQAILEQFKVGSECSIMEQIYNGDPIDGSWKGDVQQMVQTSTYFLNLAMNGLKYGQARQTLQKGLDLTFQFKDDLKDATDTIQSFMAAAQNQDFANAKFNLNIVFNDKAKQYPVTQASSQSIANSIQTMLQQAFPQYKSIVIVYNGQKYFQSTDYAYAWFLNGIIGTAEDKFAYVVHLIPAKDAHVTNNLWYTQSMKRYFGIGQVIETYTYALQAARACANHHQNICLTGVVAIYDYKGEGKVGHAISPEIQPLVQFLNNGNKGPTYHYMWIMDWNIGSNTCITF